MINGCALAILGGVYLETTNAAEVYCLNKSSGLSVMTAGYKINYEMALSCCCDVARFFSCSVTVLQCDSSNVKCEHLLKNSILYIYNIGFTFDFLTCSFLTVTLSRCHADMFVLGFPLYAFLLSLHVICVPPCSCKLMCLTCSEKVQTGGVYDVEKVLFQYLSFLCL